MLVVCRRPFLITFFKNCVGASLLGTSNQVSHYASKSSRLNMVQVADQYAKASAYCCKLA